MDCQADGCGCSFVLLRVNHGTVEEEVLGRDNASQPGRSQPGQRAESHGHSQSLVKEAVRDDGVAEIWMKRPVRRKRDTSWMMLRTSDITKRVAKRRPTLLYMMQITARRDTTSITCLGQHEPCSHKPLRHNKGRSPESGVWRRGRLVMSREGLRF